MTFLIATLLSSHVALAEQPGKRLTDAERGEQLWERHCVACHGPANRGDGPATEALVVEVPDLQGEVEVNDETLKLVLKGRGAMPGYETSFDKADARRVLQYMAKVHQAKRKAPPPPKAPAAPKAEASPEAQGPATPPAGDAPAEE